jgi:hypothetical protein
MWLIVFIVQIIIAQSNETTAVIYGMNDTVLVTEVRRNILPEQVTVKLSGETNFPSQTVHIFTMPCDKLSSHYGKSTVNIYSANMSVDHQDTIMSPTYLVSGSRIEVLVNIPDASVIDIDISLYIFKGLDEYPNYASHLDKSTYQATVYISGPGMQNTSTLVNYTIQSTDYYFVVIDSNAPVIAQFDITLHKQLYNESDYKEVCAITGRAECPLPVSKHECINILAHPAYTCTHDLKWLPAHITVTHFEYGKLSIFSLIFSIVNVCPFMVCCLVRFCYRTRKGHNGAPLQTLFCKI